MTDQALTLPRFAIRDDEELRARIDIDPTGNRTLRVELIVEVQEGRGERRALMWMYPVMLKGFEPDFEIDRSDEHDDEGGQDS